MITFLTEPDREISQESYRTDWDRLPLKHLRCSRCGCVGQLTRHAYYTRKIRTCGEQVSLTIGRLRCAGCSHTHAVVPSCIVPYCQVTIWDQAEILRKYIQGLTFYSVLERNPAVDEGLSYSILRKYRKYWQKHVSPEQILLIPLEDISRFCFSGFDKQFMQVRDIPNNFFY